MKRFIFLSAMLFCAILGAEEFTHQIKCVSHRGEEFDAPEGSRPAYLLAVRRKADIVKLDICFTKDNIPVMSHDPTLKRMMKWNVKIAQKTLEEIRKEGTFRKVGEYSNEKIVTLAEALQIVKGVPEFWVDFKSVPPDGIDRIVDEFKKAGIALDRVMIATYNREAVRAAKAKYPVIRRVLHYSIRKTPEGKLKCSAPPGIHENKEAMLQAIRAEVKSYNLYGMNLPIAAFKGKILNKEDLQAFRKSGLWCSLWFAHKANIAEFAAGLGGDAFVTGKIEAARPYCRIKDDKSTSIH